MCRFGDFFDLEQLTSKVMDSAEEDDSNAFALLLDHVQYVLGPQRVFALFYSISSRIDSQRPSCAHLSWLQQDHALFGVQVVQSDLRLNNILLNYNIA